MTHPNPPHPSNSDAWNAYWAKGIAKATRDLKANKRRIEKSQSTKNAANDPDDKDDLT